MVQEPDPGEKSTCLILNRTGCVPEHLLAIIQEAKLQKMRQQAEESPGWIDDIWIGVKMFWFQALWFKAMLLLSFWCGLGVLFAMLSAQVAAKYWSPWAVLSFAPDARLVH